MYWKVEFDVHWLKGMAKMAHLMWGGLPSFLEVIQVIRGRKRSLEDPTLDLLLLLYSLDSQLSFDMHKAIVELFSICGGHQRSDLKFGDGDGPNLCRVKRQMLVLWCPWIPGIQFTTICLLLFRLCILYKYCVYIINILSVYFSCHLSVATFW